ncbi:hydroxyacid dehydrogenase (plasmid) [Rhizobium sp. CB3171]|uniref:hydroxyacid dehydrogenase n=1 Tax=unclassified Rhizobium TaxID=2613769 RepID=UPI000CDF4F0B|nr:MULTISPECIES: hydroxyacid dehydrogenase [Rhizobium]AVA26564.1 D-2-hydroxyacid dehydrogenase protein [Rhizobium sp. NXC24]UWU24187.1 hydroxyacid dehydrogenase [Rhizobium tropici]WFU05116.1 hydroxyacid dehydrogenase [Rhizobium sp. CB3171]
MKKILVVQPLRPEALRLFDQRTDVSYEVVADFSRDNLLKHVGDADAITVRDAPLPADVLAAAPNLKIVSRHGVGYDNIPIDYCTSRGIPVTVVGDVNAISVAEQTMFLMLAAAKSGVQLDAAVRRGDFAARSRLIGIELRGRTLLVVGFGRIGREVAKRSASFGMDIVVYDPYAKRSEVEGATFVDSLEDGLAAADVVTLHIPLSDTTRNLIDADALRQLKRGAIIINTARGGIIDEDALGDALADGQVRAAGLDTFATEPLPTTDRLVSEERVVLSPHSAALTEESLIAMGVMTARNALAGIDGNLDPQLVVNRSVLKVSVDAK